jgi:hypothetical protein
MTLPFGPPAPLLPDPALSVSKPATEILPADEGLVARFRKRLFEPRTRPVQPDAIAPAPAPLPKRELNLRASLSELLLVTRLRARRKAAPSADVLAQGERIVYVTCKSWFGTPDSAPPDRGTRL